MGIPLWLYIVGVEWVAITDVLYVLNLNSIIHHCILKTIPNVDDMSANITKYISRYHVFDIDIKVIDFTISIAVG
jgi:hypothetical protein